MSDEPASQCAGDKPPYGFNAQPIGYGGGEELLARLREVERERDALSAHSPLDREAELRKALERIVAYDYPNDHAIHIHAIAQVALEAAPVLDHGEPTDSK